MELLRKQTMMFTTQKQQRAVETGSMARTATQRGPGLRGDLRRVLPPAASGPGPGRGGAEWDPGRLPAAAARGQPGSAPEAGRTRGKSGSRGAAPLSGPGLGAPGRVCVSVAGTAGTRGAAPERQAGPGSCGARARGARRARAALLPTLPPACLARSPGLVSSGSGQCLGLGPARSPERLVLGHLPTACLGPSRVP